MERNTLRNFFISVLISMSLPTASVRAETVQNNYYLVPEQIMPKGNAEYYPSNSKDKVVVPVRVLGEVSQPGIHYVSKESLLVDVLSVAGGPTSRANLSNVKLVRGDKKFYYDLDDAADMNTVILPKDTIYVDYSMKQDLPLIFSGISAVVSVLTLYFVTRQK